MRWYNIRRYALMLLLGLFLLLALLLGGMMTQSGLHLALNAAARWVPGLEIGRVEGGWRDLTLRDVGYRMPGVDVSVGQFHLSLDIGCLKRSELCLNVLSVQRVRVNVDTQALPPSEPQVTPSAPLGRLSTPYPFVLRLLRLHDVQVNVDGTAITLDALRSGAEWRGSLLRLQPSDIQGLRVSLPPSPATPPVGGDADGAVFPAAAAGGDDAGSAAGYAGEPHFRAPSADPGGDRSGYRVS